MKKIMILTGLMLTLCFAANAQSSNTNGTMNTNGTGQNNTTTPNMTSPNAGNVHGYNNNGTNSLQNNVNTNSNRNMNRTNTNTNTLYKSNNNALRTDSIR